MTAADRPSVTDNARAEAERRVHTALSAWEGEEYTEGYVYGFTRGAGWAAGRAETTTATDEDAAQVMDDVIQHLRKIWSTGHDEAREVIDTAEELLSQALPRLLATARTRPTREQIAQVLYVHDNGATLYGAPMTYMDEPGRADDYLAAADAVLALYADQPTEAEAGARALEQAAEQTYTKSNAQWLRDRAASLRGGER